MITTTAKHQKKLPSMSSMQGSKLSSMVLYILYRKRLLGKREYDILM